MRITILKRLFARIGCKHTYIKTCAFSGEHTETGKIIDFEYDFECSKCGKQIHLIMDKTHQIENP